jgi:diguanylate cyclase (GGDEF)-like protein
MAQDPVLLRRGGRPLDDATRAAAIEAFLSDVAADPLSITRPPARAASETHGRVGSPELAPPAPLGAPERTRARLVTRADWDRAVAAESQRVARFGNPATVVMAELARLDALSDRLGRNVANQVVAEIAHLIESESRAADPIAHLSHGMFGALLLETAEDGATHYIDRVRAAADSWLENAGLTLRLSLGWATPPAGGDVAIAVGIAQQRMYEASRVPLCR